MLAIAENLSSETLSGEGKLVRLSVPGDKMFFVHFVFDSLYDGEWIDVESCYLKPLKHQPSKCLLSKTILNFFDLVVSSVDSSYGCLTSMNHKNLHFKITVGHTAYRDNNEENSR